MCKEIRLTSGSESSESITLGTSVDSIFTPRVATQEKESNPATAQDNTQVVKTEVYSGTSSQSKISITCNVV